MVFIAADSLGKQQLWIRALDSDRPQDVAVRVIPLKNVSAQDLVKEIGPLYQKLTAKSPTICSYQGVAGWPFIWAWIWASSRSSLAKRASNC